jgi:glycosyltransferase involved in cell wall biosynthesis
MPKIIIATIMRPIGESGLQTHFQQFAHYLRDGGIPFALVTPFDAPGVLVYPTFALRKLLGPLNGSLNVWWYMHWHGLFLQHALTKCLSDGAPHIVYAQNPPSAIAALRARANPSQRVVMAVHFNKSEADEWVEKGLIPKDGLMYRRIRARELAAFQSVNAIVHFSQFMSDMLQQELAVKSKSVQSAVIPNFITDPVNEDDFTQTPADLINIGTFEPRKNQSFIIDVLAAARQRGHSLTATLIGDGPTRREVETKAHRLGLSDRVRFLGYIQNAATQMRGHRAYIHAARIENFPFVLIEAMARGLPIFAPPVGGVPEVFRNGVEGQYLSLDSSGESAVRILNVLTNPSLLRATGVASRTRFLQRYETKVVAPKLLRFLRELG